jgi:hypothetical protein
MEVPEKNESQWSKLIYLTGFPSRPWPNVDDDDFWLFYSFFRYILC